MRYVIILFLTLCCQLTSAQLKAPVYVSMSTPEGKKFSEYLRKYHVYPRSALVRKVEGIVHVSVHLDSSYHIIPDSVKVVSGLDPDCDNAAVRLVKIYEGSLTAHPTHFRGPMIVPIFFMLDAFSTKVNSPRHVLQQPIQTIVVPKGFSTKSQNWNVYTSPAMSKHLKTIRAGDTVKVSGWSPGALFIQTPFVTGFLSRHALRMTTPLDSIARLLEEQYVPEPEAQTDVHVVYDTAKYSVHDHAYLSLDIADDNIIAGECTTVTLSFNVLQSNKARIQFYDLGTQHIQILHNELKKTGCLIVDAEISNIEGVEQYGERGANTKYDIYSARYCPVKAGAIDFPKINLNMLVLRLQGDTVIGFQSKPRRITIRPLPTTAGTDKVITGKFTVIEEVLKSKLSANEKFIYQLTVLGNAPTIMIEPPDLSGPALKSKLTNIVYTDTIIGKKIQSKRTFVYECLVEKPGTVSLVGKFTLATFDPVSGKRENITSKKILTVGPAVVPKQSWNVRTPFLSKENFIVIDVSSSMEISDYKPTRLETVKNGIARFLNKRKSCDIGIVIFGGNAKHLDAANTNYCYDGSSVASINYGLVTNGTAIGDAIWFAALSGAKNATPKNIIIIGDGDKTAGQLYPEDAAELARKKNCRVHAIGIGSHGEVPFTKEGVTHMITNTFSENDFKKITEITGGKYLHAKDANEIADFLELVFPKK